MSELQDLKPTSNYYQRDKKKNLKNTYFYDTGCPTFVLRSLSEYYRTDTHE